MSHKYTHTCMRSRKHANCRATDCVAVIRGSAKTLPRTNTCLSRQIFVATKHFFRDKLKKNRDKSFVATKVLSRQAYFCRDKRRVLSWQARVCRDRTFVATKIILVAAPANDRPSHTFPRQFRAVEQPFIYILIAQLPAVLTQNAWRYNSLWGN